MNLISKHLDRKNLKSKVWQFRYPMKCAFSGESINEGVLLKDLIGDTFTDKYVLRYNSKYVSIDFAMLVSDVIPSEKGFNILRSYSFFSSDSHFRLLSREEILPLLLEIPETPFQIGVTYSSKKHISYKTPINYNGSKFVVCTDVGLVDVDISIVRSLLPIIQSWYTVIPDKAQQPTYFTKSEIKGEDEPSVIKIKEYGISRFLNENAVLQKYRKTMFFNFLIHILNKSE